MDTPIHTTNCYSNTHTNTHFKVASPDISHQRASTLKVAPSCLLHGWEIWAVTAASLLHHLHRLKWLCLKECTGQRVDAAFFSTQSQKNKKTKQKM